MRRLNKATRIVFLSLVLLLTAALIATSVVIVKKNNEIDKINAVVTQNEAEIDEINKKNADLEEKLAESEKSADKAKSKLEKENDTLSKENSKLEKENKELKAKIEKLSLKSGKTEAVKPTASKKSPAKKVKPGSKVCYLTFDDGPSENTLKILKILKKYDAKATFFVINTSEIEYVKKIHKAGHTVGLHSYTHVYSNIYSSKSKYFKDLNKISKKVEELTGVESKIIRFPGGGSNTVSAKYSKGIMTKLAKETKKKGYYYFDWNVSSGDADARFPKASVITNNVLTQAKNKDSICVLMHDSADKTATVKALPDIIEGLIEQGYRFEALTEESKGYHHPILN